ncbi:MAG: DUF3226 domain-containing protein [Halothece sp. Uz-M2-17]|nr:DUF3226 domain-containing protein [Halothece sp. Uz-M2-17]
MVNYAFIGVEGNHDQAFVGKILKLLGLEDFREKKGGLRQNLDPFWSKLIPSYPTKKGELYKRLPMPSILYNKTLSVAIYGGEGSSLKKNVDAVLTNESKYQTDLSSFIIIADADDKPVNKIVTDYANYFQTYFPDFPNEAGVINQSGSTSTGIYVLPNNNSQGTLDKLLCQCGEVAYSEYMSRATDYLEKFTERKWKKFDYEKALIATIVSVLKPGKTNTVSINDNNWVSAVTQEQVHDLKVFIEFIAASLNITF